MNTTLKYSARQIAEALYEYGIRDVVVSPGSRNTPLIIALDADRRLHKHVIIDERSAAFAALGMSLETGCPVACVCTSGSAVLNYAPAVAEAYYRGVPLVVISADRPAEWIDQDDSQTIRQYGVLSNFVKGSFNIADCGDGPDSIVDRTINDALSKALDRRKGPVHINMEFDEPLGEYVEIDVDFRRIIYQGSEYKDIVLPDMPYERILIVAGFHSRDSVYSGLLERIQSECGIPVLCEVQSNVAGINASSALKYLGKFDDNDFNVAEFVPELIISLGGAVVSKSLKSFLRDNSIAEHWYVGFSEHAIDCYRKLTRRFDLDATVFLEALYRKYSARPALSYGRLWRQLSEKANRYISRYIADAPWCGMKAMKCLLDAGAGASLHIGNGTAIRLAQFCDCGRWKSIECNRGVSGIDGSLSTAAGAALTGAPVMLVCGDMSAQYDMGALAIADVPDSFRLVVLDNRGGGIFRMIASTKEMESDMREYYYSGNVNLPLSGLADSFGFEYFEACSEESLMRVYAEFLACRRKAILRIATDPGVDTAVFSAL